MHSDGPGSACYNGPCAGDQQEHRQLIGAGTSPLAKFDGTKDKVTFLDLPFYSKEFFGPAMDGFAERFTAAQKSLQAIHNFLPKRSSSVADSSCQKDPSSQKPAKSMQFLSHPQAKSKPGLQQHPQTAKRHLFPKFQGPCPRVTLDPELQKLS